MITVAAGIAAETLVASPVESFTALQTIAFFHNAKIMQPGGFGTAKMAAGRFFVEGGWNRFLRHPFVNVYKRI